MSGFSGINQFGSLTVNGQKLKFEDFDKDKNGEISKDEYDSVLKEMKLDSVELSSVDKNGDNVVSEDEFALWEQKTQMQEAVNNMAATISKDFSGKTQYLTSLTSSLRDYIEEFALTYEEDVSGMAEAFKETLPTKYNEIKASLLSSDPDTAKSNVLDEIYTELMTPNSNAKEGLPAATAKRIATELEKEADKFLKTYKGNNLAVDLKAHLKTYMNKSDAEKLKSAAEEFKANANSFGAMIDNGAELKQLKEYAKEFLTQALNAGVTIKLGGTTIKTVNAITTALVKFKDGDELKAAMEEVIANLDTQTMKEKLVLEEEVKAIEAANKAFTDIKGEEYAVNASLIDYSGIDGYFNNAQIHERGKGWSGSKDKAYNKGIELLNNESLKNQMKAQIQEMLQSKGIPFERIEQIFENVYNASAIETLNADGMITGRGARGFSSKGHAYLNTKDCVDAFITTFNTNIAKAIDEVNKSDKDFDTIDLNMSVLGTDENGNKIETANNDDILKSYQTGTPLTTKKHGADYYVKIAEQVINGLKAQMMAKAKNMCKANGVEFDLGKFNTMFNNARSLAVNSAVTGIDGKKAFGGKTGKGAAIGAASGAGAIGATGATVGAVVGGSAAASVFGAGAALVAAGPLGLVAGAVVGGIIALIGNGHHSQSTLDTRALIDGFTAQFAADYSQWVEDEKADAKNNK